MIRPIRAFKLSRTVLCVAGVAFACMLASAASAAAETTVVYVKESQQAYEQQLASGQIQAVTVNKKLRSLRITLKDGSYVLAKYGRKEEPKTVAALEAKHVPVTILTPTEAAKQVTKKPVHHKLRYIVGGIVIVVIVIVGAVLYINRKRQSERE